MMNHIVRFAAMANVATVIVVPLIQELRGSERELKAVTQMRFGWITCMMRALITLAVKQLRAGSLTTYL